MRTALLLPGLAGSMALSAQNFPFPISDATWVQYFETMITPPPFPQFAWISTANFCMDGSDTLIAGTNYTRLDHCNAGYVGGIRSVDEAVYFFPADSTQEYLLYDFGAAVGDTLYDVYVNELLATGSEGWMGTRLVDVVVTGSAPHPDYGGRIAMQLQTLDPDLGTDSEWIEGMGCIHGLFTLNPINISEYWYGLDCFSHNDTTYWNSWYTESPGVCAPLYVGIDEHRNLAAMIFPNPTTGTTTLTGMDTGNGPVVRDALGRLMSVPTVRTSNEEHQLDFSAMPSGLYLIGNASGNRAVRLMRE